jgi:hypothetical protein
MISAGAGSCDTDLECRFAGISDTRGGRLIELRVRVAEGPRGIRWGPTSDDFRFKPASALSFALPLSLLAIS